MNSERPFAFAGLWDRWTGADGQTIESCAILTTMPNKRLASIHDRMPVILQPAAYEPWLDPGLQDAMYLAPFLTPFPADAMVAVPVSRLVNDPRVDDARCLEALGEPSSNRA